MTKKPFSASTYLVIGFMLFALFFGAGNLIFPAFLGAYAGSNLLIAVASFCLTGVTLPLLGVVSVAYSGLEDLESLARPVSKVYAIFFAVALYLSIGPFFAIPRTGATSYAIGIQPIFGDSLLVKTIYALVFFGLSYLLAVRPSKIADVIGKYLTPALLLVIGILVVASFIMPAGGLGTPLNAASDVSNAFADLPFVAGLIQGYGTMDALASLAFASLVIKAAKNFGAKSKESIALVTLKSGLIAILTLAIIYFFVARIGATSQSLFEVTDGLLTYQGSPIDGGTVLSQAAAFYLGRLGQIVLSLVIFLACLTTSTGLITACADYFHQLIPGLSHLTWSTIFTAIATSFYFGGLSEIIKWSIPVLYLLYPLTVALILLVLTHKLFQNHALVYRTTIGLTFIAALYDASSTLASLTGLFSLPTGLTDFFTKTVPLGQYSLGWISFTLVGYLLGLGLYRMRK